MVTLDPDAMDKEKPLGGVPSGMDGIISLTKNKVKGGMVSGTMDDAFLFNLLTREGVGLVAAEDEDLTVTEDFGILYLVTLYIFYA